MPPPKIVTETEYITPPKPIVPKITPLNLRDVEFIIVTPDNVEEVWSNLRDDQVLFALTAEDYEAIALNLSDVRAYIDQQKEIILLYENSYEE